MMLMGSGGSLYYHIYISVITLQILQQGKNSLCKTSTYSSRHFARAV